MRGFPKAFDRRSLAGLPSVTFMYGAMINSSRFACRRIMRSFVFLSIAGALALAVCAAQPHSGMPRAQKHESRHEIDHLEEVWQDAVLKGNAAAMDSLMAADYLAITPNGTMQSREETLANLRSGAVHLTAIEINDRRVRFYGNTALVTCRAEVTGTTPGGEISGGYRYTRVYVRDAQGKWKIVSFEANKIREPGERK
jgi:ketosteroid isomerase-like protein